MAAVAHGWSCMVTGDGPDGGHRHPLLLCVSKWSCSRPDTAQLPCCLHAAASRPSAQAAVLTAPK